MNNKNKKVIKQEDFMSIEIYTNEDLLYKLQEYFVYKFDLENNKNDIMIFYNQDFWFSARKTSTMDKIDNLSLNEIYKSCNSIDSDDEKFYDEEDLLEELNTLVQNNNIVDYLVNFLTEVYGAYCYKK